MEKPRTTNSASQQELAKAAQNLAQFEDSVQRLTNERNDNVPVQEVEPQTKLSSREIANSKDIYLKPEKTMSCKESFNEKFRKNYEYDKEYVHFIAENKELIGEMIEIWTRPYPGKEAEFWKVPTNKPVWGPRYLAEQIHRKAYNRLKMEQTTTTSDGIGSYYGNIAIDTRIQRLDAYKATSRTNVFMGANNF